MDLKTELYNLIIKNDFDDYFSIPKIASLKAVSAKERKLILSDYAQACGGFVDNFNPGRYTIYVFNEGRSFYASHIVPIVCSNGKFNYNEVTSKDACIAPRMILDIDKLKNSRLGEEYKIDPIEKTISFSKLTFPQRIAPNSDQLEMQFKKNPASFKTSGKTFSGKFINAHSFDCLEHNNEYLIEGKLYARVKVLNNQSVINTQPFSDGKVYENGRYIWCMVEPIVWKIDNFGDIATLIDENSIMLQKTSHRMYLHARDGIISGMPFYPAYEKINNYCELYQNSLIRAYLNSLNTYANIEKNPKKFKLKAPQNFNFVDNGFIDEIIASDIENLKEDYVNGEYNLVFDNTPLSVKEQMRFYLNTGKSFMLHGPSGVGKTRRVQELDPDCVCIQLRDGMLPEEIIGKTSFDGNATGWIEPTWYTRLKFLCNKEPEKKHILFIDELTNVHENEQSLVYHIVLEHSIDGNLGALPKNCVVVAAGNNPDESEAAYNMPEPLFRRFEGHIYLQPNLSSFLEWGSGLDENGNPKIHPLIAEFLASNKGNAFYSKYDSISPPKFAIDPRGWEQVSKIIYDNKGVLRFELLASKLGEDIASDLMAFAKLPKISISDIMNDKIKTSIIPPDKDSKFALTCALRSANEKQVEKVRQFIKIYLGEENLAFFDSMWCEDNEERAILIGQIDSQYHLEALSNPKEDL